MHRPPAVSYTHLEAAAEFNSSEQAFVNSARGKKKVADGPHVALAEEASLLEAERLGRELSLIHI